ncbi:hypothetical protein MPC1_1230005 [Methylocella tundrae]|nr:hypothetical protein MPC1_1230005 [Methylocella tundrae]
MIDAAPALRGSVALSVEWVRTEKAKQEWS